MKQLLSLAAALLLSCGGGVVPDSSGGEPGAATTTTVEGIGDPCISVLENDPSFLGFNEKEVNLETESPGCKTRVCLANHFRGRASCPYGQDANGQPPRGAKACVTTGPGGAVTGGEGAPLRKASVAAQCVDRSAANAVYCSCRCANVDGRTDDGDAYCACSAGFACTHLFSSFGADKNHIAGSYCVKEGTAYDRDTACSGPQCDPLVTTCP